MVPLPGIKSYFTRAFALYKARWMVLLGVVVAGTIMMAIPSAAGALGAAAANGPAGLIPLIVGGLAALWVFSWAEAAFCVALSLPDSGLKTAFSSAWPRALPLMKVNILMYLIQTAAYFVLVGEDYDVVKLDAPDLGMVVVVPEIDIENKTRTARELLPEKVSLRDAVRNIGHATRMTAAVALGDPVLFGKSVCDNLVEPHRASMIPRFWDVKQAALDAGAYGCSISGGRALGVRRG